MCAGVYASARLEPSKPVVALTLGCAEEEVPGIELVAERPHGIGLGLGTHGRGPVLQQHQELERERVVEVHDQRRARPCQRGVTLEHPPLEQDRVVGARESAERAPVEGHDRKRLVGGASRRAFGRQGDVVTRARKHPRQLEAADRRTGHPLCDAIAG